MPIAHAVAVIQRAEILENFAAAFHNVGIFRGTLNEVSQRYLHKIHLL
jgi:hypothetical protein